MKIKETYEIEYQIIYKRIGINKVSIHYNKKDTEKEIKNFLKENIVKKNIKKEELKEICKYIEILKIKKLKIINLEQSFKRL